MRLTSEPELSWDIDRSYFWTRHGLGSNGETSSINSVISDQRLGQSQPGRLSEPGSTARQGQRLRQSLSYTKCVSKFVLQTSIPAHIRQLILYISNSKGYVDGFVGELTSTKRL